MRQHEQLLPRAVTAGFTAFGVSRSSSRAQTKGRELVAMRTELSKANEALRQARARCERLEESASRQALARLAMASHDLRDPLQVIASHVELVAEGFCGVVSAEQRACLERVRAQVDHLAAVVGSVLTLARAAHQGDTLELSDVPVPQLLAQVRTLVDPFAAAMGVSLVLDCDRAPALVRGDRTALVRVLVNLAGNGVKATPRGGTVFLTATTLANSVELRVADRKPGGGWTFMTLGGHAAPFAGSYGFYADMKVVGSSAFVSIFRTRVSTLPRVSIDGCPYTRVAAAPTHVFAPGSLIIPITRARLCVA